MTKLKIKFDIKRIIARSYSLSFNNLKKLIIISGIYSCIGTLLALSMGALYNKGYDWLIPGNNLAKGVALLASIKIILFSLFIISWSDVVSRDNKITRNWTYYIKILTFIAIWLIWHYVSFLGIYYIAIADFTLVNLFIITLGAYLPFIWVRFYSMLAKLLDNKDIENLSMFFHLTKGQTINICMALLFVVIPCGITTWTFVVFYNGNLLLGDFLLNLILLIFTSIWINHCYCQERILNLIKRKSLLKLFKK